MAYMTRNYLSAEQVAEMFATDVRAVRRWINRGDLKAVNIGTPRRPMYRVSEVELARYEEARSA